MTLNFFVTEARKVAAFVVSLSLYVAQLYLYKHEHFDCTNFLL